MDTRLDLAALTRESEAALWRASVGADRRHAHAARRTTNSHEIYELWRLRHERLMRPVASAAGRFGQQKALRSVGVRLVRRCALVDYLRENRVDGPLRDRLIAQVTRVSNTRRALLEEHRRYVLAVSSEACVDSLLALVEDPLGPRLLGEYRAEYSVCFAPYLERVVLNNLNPDREPFVLGPDALRLHNLLVGSSDTSAPQYA